MKIKLLSITVLMFFITSFLAMNISAEVKIGVLAKRGAEKCLKKWLPTADYLSEAIG